MGIEVSGDTALRECRLVAATKSRREHAVDVMSHVKPDADAKAFSDVDRVITDE